MEPAPAPAEALAQLRRGLEHLPENTELLLALVDTKVGQGQISDLDEEIKHLRKLGAPENTVRLQEARILARQGEWLKASVILQQITPVLVKSLDSEELAKEAMLELGLL